MFIASYASLQFIELSKDSEKSANAKSDEKSLTKKDKDKKSS